MAPRATFVAATALIGLAARVVRANDGSDSSSSSGFGSGLPTDFQRCFCWDSAKGQMCGGSDFFNTEPCQNWLVNHFWWLPVALVAVIAALIFPCVFYCARCLCNCCGGRHASHGACCSTEIGRAAFPGYRNGSIVATKVFFLICLALTVGMSVRGLQNNSHLDTTILAASNVVEGAFTDYKNGLTSLQTMASNIQSTNPYMVNLIPQQFQNGVQSAYSQIDSRINDAHDRIHDVKKVETKVRNGLAMSSVIQGLVLLGIGMLLALFSFRQAVGIVMVGFCIHVAFATVVLAPHQVLRIASNSVCDNYDSTIVPLATGALQSIGVCGNSDVAAGVVSTTQTFAQFVTDGNSQFCQDYAAACTVVGNDACYTTPCNSENPPFPNMVPASVSSTNLESAVNTIVGLVNVVANTNIYSPAVSRLISFTNNQAQPLVFLMQNAQTVSSCSQITTVLQTTIRPAVCSDDQLRDRAATLAGDLTVLVGTGFATIVALIFGMKRFRRLNSYASNTIYAVVEEQQPIINVTATRVAIIGKVCTDDQSTVVAAVYPSGDLYGYPAQYGATESTNEYRQL